MLDPYIRPLIDPPLNAIGGRLAKAGITSNGVTILGFIFGLAAITLIVYQDYMLGLSCLIANRLCDGLDGAIARHQGLSDFGGFLDIVCDFIIYAGIVFAFGIAEPEHLMYASFLIFSFIGPITSFLAYAILAAKNQKHTSKRGKKSFYYLGGICEGTETTAVLFTMCIFPNLFNEIGIIYGILCWLTTFGRVYAAWCDFGTPELTLGGSSESTYTKQVREIKLPTPQEPQ